MFLLGPLLLTLATLATARISHREHLLKLELELLQEEESVSGFSAAVIPEVHWESVSLPISYTDPSVGNFTNRFWVVDEYYRPGGPVIVFDTGESDGGQGYIGRLTTEASIVNQYLRQFGAIGIVWEHRYYGESLPFPLELDIGADKMQYLTTENALRDTVVWAEQFQWNGLEVSPKQTPWVVMGGSYPGMRAAMLRQLYPDTFYAAYASSAPIQAQRDMNVYWEQVYRGMQRYNLNNCTTAVKLAVDYMDKQLSRPSTSAALKLKFFGRTGDKATNAGFADTLHFPFWNWQGRGVDPVLREFCAHLTAVPAPRREQGKHFAERWANDPNFIGLVNDYITTNGSYCEGPVRDNTKTPNCQLDGKFEGALSIAWTWQYCLEWGFFQHTNAGPHASGSRYDDYNHQQQMCYRQFPADVGKGLPRAPKTEYINKVTGGWWMRPSNTFWTGGEFDPWRTLSPLSAEPWSEKFSLTEKIPKCGVPTGKRELFGHLLKNSEHCYDLRNGWEQAKRPNALFAEALEEWLKCFEKKY